MFLISLKNYIYVAKEIILQSNCDVSVSIHLSIKLFCQTLNVIIPDGFEFVWEIRNPKSHGQQMKKEYFFQTKVIGKVTLSFTPISPLSMVSAK